MAQHRRSRIGWFRLRRSYRALWLQYQGLLKDYNDLRAEHEIMMRPPEPFGRQTSWGRQNEDLLETAEIPVITSVPVMGAPLDPDKASALVRNTGLLMDAGGWPGRKQGRTG